MAKPAGPPLRALSVASEVFPLIKTGGLADVTGALPGALAREGVAMRTLIPGYPAVMAALMRGVEVLAWPDWFGGPAQLLAGKAAGLDLFVLDIPHLYNRPGGPYSGPDGKDWPDNAQRFAALARAAALIGQGAVASFVPDIVHAHDWQAGLTPAYFEPGRRPGTVFTVHNLAFQGWFEAGLLEPLGLPASAYTVDGVEYYGGIGMLKAGLALSDRITTVSPTYAAEIQTDAGGAGLAGLLRTRAGSLSGILNGLDGAYWNPASDPHLTAAFGPGRLTRRARNKTALQVRMGLAERSDLMLLGVVSRLTEQKGMDILLQALPGLIETGAQFVMLGTGDPTLSSAFATIAQAHPGQVSVLLGFDEAVSHQIYAGVDALAVPSRFEPCGLTQLCAMRYGAVPVVSRVGGLNDTVIDANDAALAAGVATGIQFTPVDPAGLATALRRLRRLWSQPKAWAAVQRNGMKADFSWEGPSRAYAALYREIAAA